jgi:hypothetical protein
VSPNGGRPSAVLVILINKHTPQRPHSRPAGARVGPCLIPLPVTVASRLRVLDWERTGVAAATTTTTTTNTERPIACYTESMLDIKCNCEGQAKESLAVALQKRQQPPTPSPASKAIRTQ